MTCFQYRGYSVSSSTEEIAPGVWRGKYEIKGPSGSPIEANTASFENPGDAQSQALPLGFNAVDEQLDTRYLGDQIRN